MSKKKSIREKLVKYSGIDGKTILTKPTKPIFIKFSHKNAAKNKFSYYLCSCGKEFVASDSQVKSGKTSSCGCFAKKVRALNVQVAYVEKHLKELEGMNEVKKRKFIKEKYSRQYGKILLELSNLE